MIDSRISSWPCWLVLGMLVASTCTTLAQSSVQGVPNALQGFSQNRDQPVKIQANSLEVRDKDQVATFLGNVNLVQGDTTLKCKTLVVHYDQKGKDKDSKDKAQKPVTNVMTAAQPGPGGQSQIKRLEAKGGVVVTQKDQTATGENGEFDMASNTVTLFGNVVVTQGQNVLRGERLVVDLTTGVSRVESGSRGRVEGLFLPGSMKDLKEGRGASKDAPKPQSSGPMRLN